MNDTLKGYKTYLYNILIALLPILSMVGLISDDMGEWVADFVQTYWEQIFTVIGALGILLRKVTDSPPGKVLPSS